MSKVNIFRLAIPCLAVLFFTGCQAPDFSKVKPSFDNIKKVPTSLLNAGTRPFSAKKNKTAGVSDDSSLPLNDILEGSLASKNQGSDFVTALRYALDTDPEVISRRLDIKAKLAAVGSSKAKKSFRVGTTLYGGIEDVTDNTKGLALSLTASRLVYDGGGVDSRTIALQYDLEAAKMDLLAKVDQRAAGLSQLWLDLEKYRSLEEQINRRLSVLDPLIDQLEKVAKAGIGDVSKVTAAQRTVSAIRVEETRIEEGLAQAELEFTNAFGSLENGIAFDYDFISNLVPKEIDNSLVKRSPVIKSQYASYQSSLAAVKSLQAKDGFEVGFEAKAMRPFAGSEYDSDESIGFVSRKTLFNGGMLESDIKEAEALAAAKLSQIKVSYRIGARSIQGALQNIESMERAILVAKENAKLTADEIAYLRQQLIIGGSTLDSVLSAEARLYDAESKEITFLTEKYKSQVVILGSLGLLSDAMDF